jgi:hypothetical protein
MDGDLRLVNTFEQDFRDDPKVKALALANKPMHDRVIRALDGWTDALRDSFQLGHPLPIPTLRGGLGEATGA